MMESQFSAWLQDRCHAIQTLEDQARQNLNSNDSEAYRATMQAKAELLADLADDGAPFLGSLPDVYRPKAQARLQRFAQSAGRAMELDSIFYMSALLFPEDHQAGQPNDLERFLAEVMAQSASTR